jgi:antitoxin component of RelBE/YafQ-DinJ toxin-antitoxin module
MPAKPRYNRRKLQARLDAETEAAFRQLMAQTGLTESALIRQLILDAARRYQKP